MRTGRYSLRITQKVADSFACQPPIPSPNVRSALVAKAAEAADGKEVVLNRTPEHASIVVEYLFGKSTDVVEVVLPAGRSVGRPVNPVPALGTQNVEFRQSSADRF